MQTSLDSAKQTLQQYFGYQNFRDEQTAIVESIINGHDTLAILATGGGKSICFQVPGLILGGTCLVISPLISLMKDQVDHLQEKGVRADFINSSLSQKEQQQKIDQLAKGYYQFFYLAPERIKQLSFLKACQQIKIPLLVVDEAHCISMWGHDFRPSYQLIKQFICQLNHRPIVSAFTATATKRVIADIKNFLCLENAKQFINSFTRKNLRLIIYHCPNQLIKQLLLFLILQKHQRHAGIIYTATRKEAVNLFQLIKHYDFYQQYNLAFYHGALDHQTRNQVQEDFLKDKLQIIIATNAFGMGVDKSNIRFVIHYQMAGNIENYYQEVGRAGRDGQISDCYLLFYQPDIVIQQQFIAKNPNKSRQQVEQKKLKQLLKLIYYPKCYQEGIAEYFSQKESQKCLLCSRCQKVGPPINLAFKNRFNLLKQFFYEEKQDIHQQILLLLALHQPQTKKDYLKIAGIGYGFVDEFYEKLNHFLQGKQTTNHDPDL